MKLLWSYWLMKQNCCVKPLLEGPAGCPPHPGQAPGGVSVPIARPHPPGLLAGRRCACFCTPCHAVPQTRYLLENLDSAFPLCLPRTSPCGVTLPPQVGSLGLSREGPRLPSPSSTVSLQHLLHEKRTIAKRRSLFW